ncbi:hypothetical protein [Streptomyces sp. NPDC001833]|uniref:hypothetical protein n=1 Tax=Streptomyces sp. NPDC001833 TaxID=3154658 RepID=UPI003320B409
MTRGEEINARAAEAVRTAVAAAVSPVAAPVPVTVSALGGPCPGLATARSPKSSSARRRSSSAGAGR